MKGIEMMKKIFQRILGVPADRVEAVAVTQRTSETPPPVEDLYRQEKQLSEVEIEGGVGEDGSCWMPWRLDPDGQQWFKRISAGSPAATIHAFDAADDADELDADEIEASEDDLDPIEAFRRETAILKSRYQRGEIGDLYGSEWTGGVDDEV